MKLHINTFDLSNRERWKLIEDILLKSENPSTRKLSFIVAKLSQTNLSKQFYAGQSMGRFFFHRRPNGGEDFSTFPAIVLTMNSDESVICELFARLDSEISIENTVIDADSDLDKLIIMSEQLKN